jgi:RNA polymerase sigma-54 factor
MSIGLETSAYMGMEQRTWIFPRLIEANAVLMLSSQELQSLIDAELSANPALEVEDRYDCPNCGRPFDGPHCPHCLGQQTAEATTSPMSEDVADPLGHTQLGAVPDDERPDPLTFVATGADLREQLLADVRPHLGLIDAAIAEWLIASLDERGYLAASLDEIAADLHMHPERVERVLKVVQECAPVGVAARDLRECLLLQIDNLERGGSTVPALVRRLVTDHLDLLGGHKCSAVAGMLGLPAAEVEAARDFIRQYLTPFPFQRQEAQSWNSPSEASYIAPDLIITCREGEFVVEVVEPRQAHLRLNELYSALAVTPGQHQSQQDTISEGERQHVREFALRGKHFLANLRQRRELLYKIATCVVKMQEGFLREGLRELRPLTRATVALEVGVHESTVSRATANKYVLLPNRRVIPFSDFFTPSLSVKEMIREIIVQERASGKRLTDKAIGDRLMRQGVQVARRTVAKYRAELGILSSAVR